MTGIQTFAEFLERHPEAIIEVRLFRSGVARDPDRYVVSQIGPARHLTSAREGVEENAKWVGRTLDEMASDWKTGTAYSNWLDSATTLRGRLALLVGACRFALSCGLGAKALWRVVVMCMTGKPRGDLDFQDIVVAMNTERVRQP